MSPWRRGGRLVLATAAGAAVGWAGSAWTGDTAWYLAIPVAIAAGWWRLADPTRCEQREER
jgi:hypothetical protein